MKKIVLISFCVTALGWPLLYLLSIAAKLLPFAPYIPCNDTGPYNINSCISFPDFVSSLLKWLMVFSGIISVVLLPFAIFAFKKIPGRSNALKYFFGVSVACTLLLIMFLVYGLIIQALSRF